MHRPHSLNAIEDLFAALGTKSGKTIATDPKTWLEASTSCK
ncbi:hypothetical protein [Roseibium sediminis]|nr:hypothetical protein [Roseibium sediminis]